MVFPAPFGPRKPEHLPGPHIQAEPVQCLHAPETLAQRFGLNHYVTIAHPGPTRLG